MGRSVMVAVLAVLAGGCDGLAQQDLMPGRSTAADVRAYLGEPTQVAPLAEGGERWEFSRQPQGTDCYHVFIDRDGRFQHMVQVMDEARRAALQTGMSREAVRELLCKPARMVFDARRGVEEWRWLIDNRQPTEPQYLAVRFSAEGRVLDSERFSLPVGN